MTIQNFDDEQCVTYKLLRKNHSLSDKENDDFMNLFWEGMTYQDCVKNLHAERAKAPAPEPEPEP